jgi:phosphonate degradation associated HDIG domain protein
MLATGAGAVADMNVVDEILLIYSRRGGEAYVGEPISVSEHAAQAAYFAREAGAAPALVLAALLHDIGHLIDEAPEDLRAWHSDARHEESGARWIAARFDASVADPVRLHVAAKRYLCATDQAYTARLSPASVHTLALQGGPMHPDELAAFERERFHADAVRLRRWDDMAKIAGFQAPAIASYRAEMESLALRRN